MNLKASRPLENEKWSKNNYLQRDSSDHRHLVNRIVLMSTTNVKGLSKVHFKP